MNWTIETRTGDTSSSKKSRQLQSPPDVLITTPESIHVLMSTKGYTKFFSSLEAIVVDEWHELVGSKRGVLVELALSRTKGDQPHRCESGGYQPQLAIWRRPCRCFSAGRGTRSNQSS